MLVIPWADLSLCRHDHGFSESVLGSFFRNVLGSFSCVKFVIIEAFGFGCSNSVVVFSNVDPFMDSLFCNTCIFSNLFSTVLYIWCHQANLIVVV
jgi:hypothetical protein